MIVNEKTAIVGRDVVLVPYRSGHVKTYHGWMQSPELREQTASEALTLEEEHQMQKNWQTDPDSNVSYGSCKESFLKQPCIILTELTFIILVRPRILLGEASSDHADGDVIPSEEEISTFPMVGDVNLFLKGSSDEGDDEAEAEVMIAEAAYRRKGVASSALHILFHYATSPDGPPSLRIPSKRLVARIGEANTASIRLFEKLSFRVTRQIPVFQEVEMRYMGDGKWIPGKCIEYFTV